MRPGHKAIVWFNEVTKEDVPTVGGKGANLGEMTRAKIPVPPGFIVTADAYFDFLKKTKLTGRISTLLKPLNPDNSNQLHQIAGQIKQLILDTPIPPEIAEEIKHSYTKMGGGLVAVRSSATAEDLPEASFAGQQRTFLNIEGRKEVIAAVRGCWASLFEPRAIFYRHQQGFDHFKVGIAVPVQKMVQSEASGVMFTIEPVTSDSNHIIIEAVHGLGEAIVSGEVTPDLYIVDKKTTQIVSKKTARQELQLVRNPGASGEDANIWVEMPPEEQTRQKVTDEEIVEIAKLGKKLEEWYKFPQDIEWAKQDREIFIVQTRPVTTIKEKAEEEEEIKAPVLLTGDKASPGIASGPAKIIKDVTHIERVHEGDILVAEMTTPDFVPAMKRAVAIVTDRGGRTAHAAIVSRELGIPCVVGTGEATTKLTNGQVVTVDGSHGKVYEGKVTRRIKTTAVSDMLREAMRTKTRVYVNLAQPELAEKVAAHNIDGVGLLRAEFIVAQIGEHPQYMIKQKRAEEFVEKLYKGINLFAQAFDPRPVVYRTNDFKTNEYRELTGGQDYESVEENPMIGYRGASRYITDIDVFKLELEAIKKVRREHKNLWVMIPFVRTVDELTRTKKIMEAEGLKRSKDFKLWMMVEVPSNVLILEKFLEVGIDGISIGSNDLTQLILGIDRDSEKLAGTFDERNEAVMVALERVIKVAKKMGVTSSICGQAPSVYPELTEKLVAWGITSVSISPDMIGTTREIIAKAEAKLRQK
jgi:pyruvate,water dikinase